MLDGLLTPEQLAEQRRANQAEKDKRIDPNKVHKEYTTANFHELAPTQEMADSTRIQSGSGSTIDINEFLPYMSQVRLEEGQDALEKTRANNQSWTEQAGAFLNQAILGEVVGGTISGVGALFEIPTLIYEKMYGETSDFSNSILEIGAALTDKSREMTPIYRKNPGTSWDIYDKGWWFSNAVSVASAASMIIPAKGVMSGMTWMNSLATAAGKKMGGKLGTALQAGSKMDMVAKNLAKQSASALAMRHAENTREAFGIVNDVQADMRNRFNDEEQWKAAQDSDAAKELAANGQEVTKDNLANHIASRAGWQSYYVNSANIMFDFIQAGALLKGNAFTRNAVKDKVTQEAIDKGTAAAKQAVTSKWDIAKGYMANFAKQGTEGIEEAINYIGEKEGKHLGEHILGNANSSFAERLGGYVNDGHMWEAAVWGAIGGVAFDLAGQLTGGDSDAKIAQAQQTTVAHREQATTQHAKVISELKKQVDAGTITSERAKELANTSASQLAFNLGMHAAAKGTTNVVLEQLQNGQFKQDILNNTTVAELKEMGIDDIDKAIAKTTEDVLLAEKLYRKAHGFVQGLNVKDPKTKAKVLATLMNHQYELSKGEVAQTSITNDLIEAKMQDPAFQKAIAADPFLHQALQVEALNSLVAETTTDLAKETDAGIKREYQKKLDLLSAEIKAVEGSVTGTMPTNTATVNKSIKELYRKNEGKRISNNYNRENVSSILYGNEVAEIDKAFTDGEKRSKEHAAKVKKAQFETKIKTLSANPNFAIALTNLKAELTGKDPASEEVKFINAQIKDVQAKLDYQIKTGQTPAPVVPDPNAAPGTNQGQPVEDKIERTPTVDVKSMETEWDNVRDFKDWNDANAKFSAIQDILNSPIVLKKKLEKLAEFKRRLEGRRKASALLTKPNSKAHVTNLLLDVDEAIAQLNQSVKVDIVDPSIGFVVGDALLIGGQEFVVTEIYSDAAGDRFVSGHTNNVPSTLKLDEVLDLMTQGKIVLTDSNKVLPLVVQDVFDVNATLFDSIVDLVNRANVPQEVRGLADFLLSTGLKVKIDTDITDVAQFDTATNTILINPNNVSGHREYNQFVMEVLLHEMVHAILAQEAPFINGIGSPERAALISAASAVLTKLKDSKSVDAKKLVDYLKKLGSSPEHSEELITYLLSNSQLMYELVHNQPDAMQDIEALFNTTLKDSKLHALYQLQKAAVNQPSTRSIKISNSAKDVAQQFNINLHYVKGTGINGQITITDIQKYVKDNNLKIPKSLVNVQNLTSQISVVEGNNMFAPIAIAGMVDGQLNLTDYNRAWKGADLTEAELNARALALLSPTTNVGSTVELVKNKWGMLDIVANGQVIGVVNNVKNLETEIQVIKQLLAIDNLIDLDAWFKTIQQARAPKTAERNYYNMRASDLGRQTKVKHKPLSTQLAIVESQHQTASEIYKTFDAIKKQNSKAKVTTKIVRKTSGNFFLAEKPIGLKEALESETPITEVFYVDTTEQSSGTKTTLRSNNDANRKFGRSTAAADYFDYDKSYRSGVMYMLVAGANTITRLINTYIPIPLFVANHTDATANHAIDALLDVVKVMRTLKGKKILDLSQNTEFNAAKAKLHNFINTNPKNKTTDGIIFHHDEKASWIEFNFTNAKGETFTGKISLQTAFSNKKNTTTAEGTTKDILNLTMYNSKNEVVQIGTGKIGKTTKKPIQVNTLDAVKYEAAFRKTLVRAFKNKQVNIDTKQLQTKGEFKIGDKTYPTYLQYLIDENILQTDIRAMRDTAGNVMKDALGNTITATTVKDSEQAKNSNLIVSIGTELAASGVIFNPKAPKTKEVLTPSTEQETAKTTVNLSNEPTPVILEGAESPQLAETVKALQAGGTVEVASIGDIVSLVTYIKANNVLSGNQVLDYTQVGDKFIVKIIDNNSGITRNRAVTDENPVTHVDKDKPEDVQRWWKETFGDNVALDNNIAGIILSQGQQAWGTFTDAMVRLSKDAPKGTAYHEAFHVVFWLYHNEEQRAKMLEEARAYYGSHLTNVELEEHLADDFSDYVMRDGVTKKVKHEGIRGFFKSILKWIKDYFAKGKASEIDKVFKQISSGGFNYKPDQALVDYAKNVVRNKVIDTFTRQEEAEVVSLLSRSIIEWQKLNANLKLKDIREGRSLGLKDAVRQSLLQAMLEVNPTKMANILRVLDAKYFDEFFNKSVTNIERNFGIEIAEEGLNDEITEFKKEWDDMSMFTTSQKDSVNNLVKSEIMSTAKYREVGVRETDTFLGLETYLDFNKVYPYIQKNMLGATDLNEMTARLETLAGHDPSLFHLLEKLLRDENLQAAWVSTFHKQAPARDMILYGEQGIKIEAANRNTSHLLLADKWNNTLVSKLESGELTQDNLTILDSNYKTGIHNLTYNLENNHDEAYATNYEQIVDLTVKTLEDLGIAITKDTVHKILNNRINIEFYGSPYNLYNKVFGTNLLNTIGDLLTAYKKFENEAMSMAMAVSEGLMTDKEIENFKPEFTSINRLNVIALHADTYQYDLTESSYFDVMGNNIYGATTPNFLSEFFAKVQAAINPKHNNRTAALNELFETLKDFAKDPAMKHSNWLWNTASSDGKNTVGSNGAFNVPAGGKHADLLSVEDMNIDFLTKWSFSSFDGIKNTDTKEGYQYNNMPDKAWELTQVMMYAGQADAGIAKVPIIVPSDSGNIWFVQASRKEGARGGTVPRANGAVINPLWQAVKNTVLQEIERMKAARDLMFTYDVQAGTWKPKEHKFKNAEGFDSNIHVDLTKLEKNFYWQKQGKVATANYKLDDVISAFINSRGKDTIQPTEVYYMAEYGMHFFELNGKYYREDSGHLYTISKTQYLKDIANTEMGISKLNTVPAHIELLKDAELVNILGLDSAISLNLDIYKNSMENYNANIGIESINIPIDELTNIVKLGLENPELGTQLLTNYKQDSQFDLPIIATQSTDGTWKPTGNVFQFNNIPSVNSVEGLKHQNMVWIDLFSNPDHKTKTNTDINNLVDAFIAEQIKEGKRLFAHTEGTLEQVKGYSKWSSFSDFIAEFMLNSYIINVEQFNFFVGNQAEYAAKGEELYPAKDINKRAKQAIAPTVKAAGIHTDPTYRAATIADVKQKSSNYEMIANTIARSLRKSNPSYANMTLDMVNLGKLNPDYSKFNKLEQELYQIIKGYLKTEISDGQGYMSVRRAKQIIKDYGRWNGVYEALFVKVEAGLDLNADELSLLLQPMKPYYYGRNFDGYLGRHVSNQVKYSITTAIPQLVRGTQLELLSNWMDENGIDEVQFVSAEKVGTDMVISVADSNGNIDPAKLDHFSLKNNYSFREYQQKDWGIQLDVPDHMMDSQNKFGTQISKMVLANIPDETIFNVDGQSMTKAEFVNEYMSVRMQNLLEDGQKLREDIGVEVDDSGNYVIKDMAKLQAVLMDEVKRRGIQDNYLDALELVDGKFTMPLFSNAMSNKWEAILTSLFTNRVVNQKAPGGSGVLLSSAFMHSITSSQNDVQGITGIQYSKELRERGDLKLRMSLDEVTKIVYAEVLLPAWSKQFYKTNAAGELVLDDIDNIPEELRTMISYRIPTEAPYSVTVFKVVGFLPAANGSTIVLPSDYVTAKGFDFDVDKEFLMYYNLETKKGKQGNTYVKTPYYVNKDEAAFVKFLATRRASKLRKDIKENADSVLKNLETQITRFKTRGANLEAQKQALYTQFKDTKNSVLTGINYDLGTEFTSIPSILLYIQEQQESSKATLDYVQAEYKDYFEGKITEQKGRHTQLMRMQQAAKEVLNTMNMLEIAIYENYDKANIETEDDIDTAKTAQESANRSVKMYQERYTEAVVAKLREEFNNMDIKTLNDRRARDNRLLDLMIARFNHPDFFSGIITPQSFNDAINALKEIEEITNERGGGLNPATVGAQLKFREQNIAGRALKGMAADSNAFLSIAQHTKMYLADELGFKVKYRVGKLSEAEEAKNAEMIANGEYDRVIKQYSMAELETKYGKENIKRVEAAKPKVVKPAGFQAEMNFGANVNETTSETNNPKDFKNFSGGQDNGDITRGGDSAWYNAGKKIGVVSHTHYKPKDYAKLSVEEQSQLNKQYQEAAKFLNRPPIDKDTYAGKLVRRDMMQANDGEAIYGITELVKPNTKGRKGYTNKARYSVPEGGTGYAVARGILANKPVYVFNQSADYGNAIGWYRWNSVIKDFVKVETPTLTKNFTGIGTQELNEVGEQAIYDVYAKTFNQNVENRQEEVEQADTPFEGNYVIVNHKNLAWNKDGTFTNVDGKNTITHSSQMLAMILDIVKEGIPSNVNTYTFNTFITMLNTGIDIRYAAMFIRQPILKDLSDLFFETQGFVEDDRLGKEIELTKNKYVTRLYKIARENSVIVPTRQNNNLVTNLDTQIANGEQIQLGAKQIKNLFDIDLEEDFAQEVRELKRGIKWGTDPKLAFKDEYVFLKQQIQLLEMFKTYKKAGEGYVDMVRNTKLDGKQVGPSLFEADSLNRKMRNIRDYADSKDEGTRVFANVNGTVYSAVEAMFPKMFGLPFDSLYPVLEIYKQEGFDASQQILAPMFIKQSPAFLTAIEGVLAQEGLRYTPELADKISSFVLTYLQKDFHWFRRFDYNDIIGIDKKANYSNEVTWEAYSKMSTANKLGYIQNKHKAKLENDTHVLNFLLPKTTEKDVARNNFHSIGFINTKTDDLTDERLVDSFREMWDSEDKELALLAQELVVYSFFSTGFQMKKDSFAKLIPTSVFSEIGLNDYLYQLQNNSRNADYLSDVIYELADRFMRSNSYDSDLVPYTYTKYEKGGKGKTRNDTPVWKPDPITEIISVAPEALDKEDYKVQSANYIIVPVYKTTKQGAEYVTTKIEDRLYKKVETREYWIDYYPVSKLGVQGMLEFTEFSNFKQNQTTHPEFYYETILRDGNKLGLSYEDVTSGFGVNQSDKYMFMTATAYIGTGKEGQLSGKFAKAFGVHANKQEYNADDLVMVTTPIVEDAAAKVALKNVLIKDNRIAQETYKGIYNALEQGATVMLRGLTDAKGEKLWANHLMYGSTVLHEHLDTFVKAKKLFKKVATGVSFYSKRPFDSDVLTTDELNSLEDNENYSPDSTKDCD